MRGETVLVFMTKEHKEEMNCKLMIIKEGFNRRIEGAGGEDLGAEVEYKLVQVLGELAV